MQVGDRLEYNNHGFYYKYDILEIVDGICVIKNIETNKKYSQKIKYINNICTNITEQFRIRQNKIKSILL